MHKILLALILLFTVFFFSSSEIYANHAKNTPLCTNERTNSVAESTVTNIHDCPTIAICYKFSQKGKYECYAPPAAAPAAPPAAAPACTGSNCTSGSGQMCYIAPGSTDDGKPIPLGLGPPTSGKTGIYTAIGCVPTEPKALVEGLLKYGTMAAGAIAFLMMLLGALGMITAEGNPEAIKHAQEQFYSALIGLLIIIFSVLLMQVIGYDILGLPGFGR